MVTAPRGPGKSSTAASYTMFALYGVQACAYALPLLTVSVPRSRVGAIGVGSGGVWVGGRRGDRQRSGVGGTISPRHTRLRVNAVSRSCSPPSLRGIGCQGTVGGCVHHRGVVFPPFAPCVALAFVWASRIWGACQTPTCCGSSMARNGCGR
jgi:hypothetical protein